MYYILPCCGFIYFFKYLSHLEKLSIQNGRFEEGKGFSRPNPVEDRLKNSGFPDIRPPKEFQV
jgi:hypothetical protein